jgi:hypothetical protein
VPELIGTYRNSRGNIMRLKPRSKGRQERRMEAKRKRFDGELPDEEQLIAEEPEKKKKAVPKKRK